MKPRRDADSVEESQLREEAVRQGPVILSGLPLASRPWEELRPDADRAVQEWAEQRVATLVAEGALPDIDATGVRADSRAAAGISFVVLLVAMIIALALYALTDSVGWAMGVGIVLGTLPALAVVGFMIETATDQRPVQWKRQLTEEALTSLERMHKKRLRDMERAAVRRRAREAEREKQQAEQQARARRKMPKARLIRTPREAELVAAEWMRYFGFADAEVTPMGADEGIDVTSTAAIAQVKMEGIKTSRPVVQNAYGVAAAEKKAALVFSLGGYTGGAVDWADRTGVALFRYDLQGVPVPANSAAEDLSAAAGQRA